MVRWDPILGTLHTMLFGVSRIQYLGTLYLSDYRFGGINKVYPSAVLAGLYELTRMFGSYYIHIWSLVPNIIMHAVDG